MPPRTSDHALKRLVSELADASDEDVSAVLSELQGPHRQTVAALLQTCRGETGISPMNARAGGDLEDLGLSPWLVERLQTQGNARDAGFVLTPAARAALRACVETLHVEAPSVTFAAKSARRGAFARILGLAKAGAAS